MISTNNTPDPTAKYLFQIPPIIPIAPISSINPITDMNHNGY
jgi:hypothetical protein